MNKIKFLLPAALSVMLLGAGCSVFQTVNVNTGANINASASVNSSVSISLVTYKGQDGKNALELLQASHQVDVSSAGFVNAIDSVKPIGKQYWAFYINGTLSDVGAKDYQTKSIDSIEWKLVAY